MTILDSIVSVWALKFIRDRPHTVSGTTLLTGSQAQAPTQFLVHNHHNQGAHKHKHKCKQKQKQKQKTAPTL